MAQQLCLGRVHDVIICGCATHEWDLTYVHVCRGSGPSGVEHVFGTPKCCRAMSSRSSSGSAATHSTTPQQGSVPHARGRGRVNGRGRGRGRGRSHVAAQARRSRTRRSQVRKEVFDVQMALISAPSVTAEVLRTSARLLQVRRWRMGVDVGVARVAGADEEHGRVLIAVVQPQLFDEVILERSLSKRCGYPRCSHALTTTPFDQCVAAVCCCSEGTLASMSHLAFTFAACTQPHAVSA